MKKYVISKTKKIILSAMFLAVLLVLSRFLSIKTNLLVISFSFIPIMLSAVYLGPKYSTIIAGLGDLIGAILFPFGAYFPGFTLTAALIGLIYGLFLYKKPGKQTSNFKFIIKLIISSILVLGVVKIFVESIWLNVLYGKAYMAVVSARIVTQSILLPIQVVVIFVLEKVLRPFVNKYLYEEEVIGIDEYLDTFDKFTKDPNLDAMKYLMNKFDNPHKNLKVIHVAGTNGKGSVCEMLNNILIESGFKVGKFVSPHLVRFNDGITINNKEISNKEVEEIILPLSEKIEEYNKTHKVPVKWFEAITSLVFIYFKQQKCDFIVLETGLGGTTDCTNIVDSIISIITNIGYDHIDVLGDSIEEITRHKAGIIKENSNTVAVYQENITPIIEEICKNKNSTLKIIKKEDIENYAFTKNLQSFDYNDYKNIEINLKGKKQIYNAAEVLECIEILNNKGYKIKLEAIKKALKTVVHKARLETLSTEPLVIFDGGHNENAINNLRENINQYYKDMKKVYIVSILKTKDYKTIVKKLVEDKDAIFFFTDGNNKKRYVSKKDLYNEAKKYINETNIFKENLINSVNIAKKLYKDNLILIIGSFYVYKDVIKL